MGYTLSITDETEYIKEHINKYFSLGFVVNLYDVGMCKDTKVFQNHHDFMTHHRNPPTDYKYLEGNYTVCNRARIRGITTKNKACIMSAILNNNDNFLVTASCLKSNLSYENSFSSMLFLDNEPMFEENKEQSKKCRELGLGLFDKDEKFKQLKDLSCRGFGTKYDPELAQERYSEHLSNMSKEDIDDLVQFDIMDKRWDNNQDLWFELLKCLRDYKNIQ
jgi:hypothetical protein